MSRKRKNTKRAPGRVPRVTSRGLAAGWSAPPGVRVRLARAGEAGDVARYMEMAGSFLWPATVASIEAGEASAAVRVALDEGSRPIFTELAGLVTGRDEGEHMAVLTTVLVAESRDGDLVGAFTGMPPFAVMAQGIDAGISGELMLAAGALIARFSGLGVDEDARGKGVGAALLKGAMRIYTQLGYRLFYGHFKEGTELERYYPRFGFEVMRLGEGLLLDDLGIPMGIATSPGERAIVHWA